MKCAITYYDLLALHTRFVGALGIVWFGFWMYFTADSPGKHPRISSEEKDYIESQIGEAVEEVACLIL